MVLDPDAVVLLVADAAGVLVIVDVPAIDLLTVAVAVPVAVIVDVAVAG